MQQQHLIQMQMQPRMAAYYHSNVTTDHIQQVLFSSLALRLFIPPHTTYLQLFFFCSILFPVSLSLLLYLLPDFAILPISEKLLLSVVFIHCSLGFLGFWFEIAARMPFSFEKCSLFLGVGRFKSLLLYLDENKSLILKIVESQNSGKLSECAENQARLQRNLMYLAAIADSQPQLPTMHSQYAGGGMLQSSPYLQHQQSPQMAPSMMTARSSMLYGAQPYPSLQTLHGQLGTSSGESSGLMLQGEPHGGSVGFPDFRGGLLGMGGGGKQDTVNGMVDGHGAGDGGQNLYLKSADDGN